MTFNIHFQGPNLQGFTLLELLADAVRQSQSGTAIFSFASSHGVRLLLQDPDVSEFLSHGKFEIIVGIDAVTTSSALRLLAEESRSLGAIQTFAFLHNRTTSLFHPKASWFLNANGGRAIIGSGNLTRGGLLNNWEAFGQAELTAQEARRIEAQWQAWRAANQQYLREPTDPEVITQARRNETSVRSEHEEDHIESQEDSIHTIHHDEEVLIAEIPRAADRWNQANFDLETFSKYFGLEPGTTRRVILFPIQKNGVVSDPEIRPSVSVKSRNFRIELGQAAGLPYPPNDAGRPIGVFRRIGLRRFRYRLLMPASDDYVKVASILKDISIDGLSRVKRSVMTGDVFRESIGEDFII